MKAVKILILLFGILVFTTASAQHGRGGCGFRGGYSTRTSYGYRVSRPTYNPYYSRPVYPINRIWIAGYWGYNYYGAWVWFPGYWR